ncbi:microneme protein, partial [Cystoisospora suis]
ETATGHPGYVPCFRLETDYFGYNVEKIFSGPPTESARRCQEACQRSASCFHWTYVGERKECYLKNEKALNGAVRNILAVSGPKTCPALGGCYETNADYYGYDVLKIEDGSVGDAQQCQSLCAENNQCYFWTFIPSKRNCYLKAYGATQGRVSHSEAVSGPKYCAPGGLPCHEVDVDYYGYDIKKVEDGSVSSFAECQSICHSLMDCKHWTWISESKNCYLKSEYATLGRIYAPGVYPPHPPVCPPDRPCPTTTTTTELPPAPEECLQHTEFTVKSIRLRWTSDVLSCQLICKELPECEFFTYYYISHICALKDKTAGSTGRPNRTAVSGHRDCVSALTFGDLIEENAEYSEPHFLALPAASVIQCRILCLATQGCNYFSFRKALGEPCLLHKSPGTQTHVEGAFSGPRYWDDSPLHGKPYCAVDNKKVVTPRTKTEAQNGEACRQACEKFPDCTGFSFNADTLDCELAGPNSTVTSETGPYYSEAVCQVSPDQLCSNNLLLVGLTLSIHTVDTSDECAIYCSEARFCKYYTFHVDTTTCVLMKKVFGAEYSPGFLSGHDGCMAHP